MQHVVTGAYSKNAAAFRLIVQFIADFESEAVIRKKYSIRLQCSFSRQLDGTVPLRFCDEVYRYS